MAVVGSGFESGSNNDALTSGPGNSGFTGGTGISGGTGVISTAQSAHGTRSALFTGTTTGNLYLYDTISASQVVARAYVRFSAFPSGADQAVIWLGNGASQRAHVEVSTTGAIRFRDDANAAQWIGSTTTSTGTMSTNTWYRIELMVTLSATAGTYRIAVFPADSTTPVTGMDSGVRTTANGGGGLNTGSDSYTQIRFGAKGSSNAGTVTMYMDDWAYDTGTTTLIGPYGVPPTVDAGANQNVAASSTVNLSATASDSDGSISSHSWSYVSASSTGSPTLTGGSTATPSFTAGTAGNLYTLQDTVTDNDGFTASDTVEIRVPVTGSTTARPLALNGTGTGSWTIAGGSSTDGAALADASDTTYLESPTISGTEVNRRVRIQPSAARTTMTIKERLATDTGTANTTIRLYEGGTLRQSWTQAITTTVTDYTFTVSGGTIAAIGDWGNLFVEVGATT